MTKDVLIRVRGLQTLSEEGEEAPIEVLTVGEYYFRNGNHYLKYEERMEGFSEATKDLIKIGKNGMEVNKKGPATVHMVFEEQKKNVTYYHTPYCNIQMGISAAKLNVEEKEDDLKVKVDYVLEMNEEYLADCYITIDVQPRNGANTTIF